MSTRRNKSNTGTPAWKAAVEEAEEFLGDGKNKKIGKTRSETSNKKLTKLGTMDITSQEGKKFLKSSPKKAKPMLKKETLLDKVKSTAKVEKPTAKAEKPTAKVEKPTAKVEKPTAKVEKPTAKVEKSSSEPSKEVLVVIDVEDAKLPEPHRQKRERSEEDSTVPTKKVKLVKSKTMEETAKLGKDYLKHSKSLIPAHDIKTRAAKKATQARRKKKSDS